VLRTLHVGERLRRVVGDALTIKGGFHRRS
jgi:hypothetical protein